MNKKLIVLPLLAACLSLAACSKKDDSKKLTNFEKFANKIYESETLLVNYEESFKISDETLEVYLKEVSVEIERTEDSVNTTYEESVKQLSATGESDYTYTTDSYYTIGNKRFSELNGVTYENDYIVPTYFLSFVVSEEYFEEGFTLSIDDDNYSLTGTVKDDYISSFFLNKSLNTVSDLTVEIVVVDSKLESFDAEYTSTKSGNKVTINTTYGY